VVSTNAEGYLGLDPDTIEKTMRELGEAYAELNAAAQLYDAMKKTIHARIAMAAPADLKSEAARERHADASAEYEEHLIAMIKARESADKAKVRYESYKAWSELKRTTAATERAMMQIR
jgi:hypothetical protein